MNILGIKLFIVLMVEIHEIFDLEKKRLIDFADFVSFCVKKSVYFDWLNDIMIHCLARGVKKQVRTMHY